MKSMSGEKGINRTELLRIWHEEIGDLNADKDADLAEVCKFLGTRLLSPQGDQDKSPISWEDITMPSDKKSKGMPALMAAANFKAIARSDCTATLFKYSPTWETLLANCLVGKSRKHWGEKFEEFREGTTEEWHKVDKFYSTHGGNLRNRFASLHSFRRAYEWAKLIYARLHAELPDSYELAIADAVMTYDPKNDEEFVENDFLPYNGDRSMVERDDGECAPKQKKKQKQKKKAASAASEDAAPEEEPAPAPAEPIVRKRSAPVAPAPAPAPRAEIEDEDEEYEESLEDLVVTSFRLVTRGDLSHEERENLEPDVLEQVLPYLEDQLSHQDQAYVHNFQFRAQWRRYVRRCVEDYLSNTELTPFEYVPPRGLAPRNVAAPPRRVPLSPPPARSVPPPRRAPSPPPPPAPMEVDEEPDAYMLPPSPPHFDMDVEPLDASFGAPMDVFDAQEAEAPQPVVEKPKKKKPTQRNEERRREAEPEQYDFAAPIDVEEVEEQRPIAEKPKKKKPTQRNEERRREEVAPIDVEVDEVEEQQPVAEKPKKKKKKQRNEERGREAEPQQQPQRKRKRAEEAPEANVERSPKRRRIAPPPRAAAVAAGQQSPGNKMTNKTSWAKFITFTAAETAARDEDEAPPVRPFEDDPEGRDERRDALAAAFKEQYAEWQGADYLYIHERKHHKHVPTAELFVSRYMRFTDDCNHTVSLQFLAQIFLVWCRETEAGRAICGDKPPCINAVNYTLQYVLSEIQGCYIFKWRGGRGKLITGCGIDIAWYHAVLSKNPNVKVPETELYFMEFFATHRLALRK